jgi:predicted nucleic acid-binding protein
MEPAGFGTSAQVLQEFFVTATRKIKFPLSVAEAIGWIERLSIRPVVTIDAALVVLGVHTAARYRLSYWDGAIIAAAQSIGAATLYSEDLNDGQVYAGVRVINPFRGTREQNES